MARLIASSAVSSSGPSATSPSSCAGSGVAGIGGADCGEGPSVIARNGRRACIRRRQGVKSWKCAGERLDRRTGRARAPAPRPASRCAGHHPVSHLGVHPGVPLDLRRKAVYVRAHARRRARAPRRDDVGEPIRLLLMGCAPREGTPVPNMIREWTRGEYTISTDPKRLDLDVIHAFLVRSYWAEGIPRDVMERSIANSINFGLYHHDTQIGFARLLTDCAVFAQLMDVFVLERARGRGLGTWLVEV